LRVHGGATKLEGTPTSGRDIKTTTEGGAVRFMEVEVLVRG